MPKLVHNKKIKRDYEIVEKLEAGIELRGFEVKSLKSGQGSLDGSFISIRGGEAFVLNMYIPPYQPANTPKNYDPNRARKLLLTKKEINHLVGLEKQKRLTVVPVSVYNKGRHIKLEIAVARGKKAHDKREDIKKRDTDREIRRTLKS